MSTKVELRQRLKDIRLVMSDGEHTIKSRQIVEKLKEAVDWSKVRSVHYFEPIRELLEIDISGLIVYLEDNFPEIDLYTPRKIHGEWEMVSIHHDKPEQDGFDVVIVPMLGFDNSLHRIGYGGGYYDKFLTSQTKAKKIGACFAQGEIDHVPAKPHDIPLDLIITEEKLHQL